jgi:hypothetical protein
MYHDARPIISMLLFVDLQWQAPKQIAHFVTLILREKSPIVLFERDCIILNNLFQMIYIVLNKILKHIDIKT